MDFESYWGYAIDFFFIKDGTNLSSTAFGDIRRILSSNCSNYISQLICFGFENVIRTLEENEAMLHSRLRFYALVACMIV